MAVKKNRPKNLSIENPWLCRNKAHGHEKAREMFDALSTLKFPSQIVELSNLIVELIDMTFCKNSQHGHREHARSRILSQAKDLYKSTDSSIELSRFEFLLSKPFQDSSSVSPGLFPTEEMLRVSNDHTLGFKRYTTHKSRNTEISEYLRFIVSKPLGKNDLKEGYIYRYWCDVFGYHKIGWTTKDVNIRGHQWEQQCKHKVQMVYPVIYSSKEIPLPHAHRLERIIHAELREHRFIQFDCKGCGKNHHEWFNSSDRHTKAVFKKWIDWIRQKPYEYVESEGEWRLKSESIKGLDRFCLPLDPSRCVPDDGLPDQQAWNPNLRRTGTWTRIEGRLVR